MVTDSSRDLHNLSNIFQQSIYCVMICHTLFKDTFVLDIYITGQILKIRKVTFQLCNADKQQRVFTHAETSVCCKCQRKKKHLHPFS